MPSSVQDFIFFVAIAAIAGGFLFAKLFQTLYNYIENPSISFAEHFNTSGITAMGGFIGGAAIFLVVYFGVGKLVFKGKKKDLHIKEFNKIFCVAPMCILIAHAFGRVGCLMAGCCHGEYLGTDYVVGGIWMKNGYYVPTQLYEALFLFALLGVLTYLYLKKNCNITMPIYLIAYAVWRIFIEFFRTDARGAVVLGLYPSQWQSVAFALMGMGLLIFYYLKGIPFFLPKDYFDKKEVEEIAATDGDGVSVEQAPTEAVQTEEVVEVHNEKESQSDDKKE